MEENAVVLGRDAIALVLPGGIEIGPANWDGAQNGSRLAIQQASRSELFLVTGRENLGGQSLPIHLKPCFAPLPRAKIGDFG